MEVRIPLLKATHEFIQDGPGQFTIFAGGGHILHISNLEDYLVKWLFLLAVTDFLVVVFNTAAFPFLLGVEGCQGFIEQFVICLLDGSVAVFGVQMRSFRVNIFCCVGATVMGNNTFAGHCADGSFYGYHLRNYDDFNQNTFRRLAAGFVTLSKVTQKHF